MKRIMKSNAKKILSLMLSVIIIMTGIGCGEKKEAAVVPGSSILPFPKKQITEVATNTNKEITLTGVLTFVDTTAMLMKYVDVTCGAEYEMAYSGGTDIRNIHNRIIAASTMKLGGIYDIECDRTGKAVSIIESDDYWEKDGIKDLEFNEDKREITLGSNKYSYSEYAVVMSGSDKISIAEIVTSDEVTLRGKDSIVYSIEVETGHGYIRFTGIDAFLGGYVCIGDDLLLGVTDQMIATAPEGTWKVEMQKGKTVASKNVTVTKNKETVVDFSEVKAEKEKQGKVTFSVIPTDAIMTIDGNEVDYSSPLYLSYGTHRVTLSAHNYQTYTQTVYVTEKPQTVIIDMEQISSSSSETKSASSSTTDYTVNVTAPEGAALYVDSVYIGIIPCSFKKTEGKKTITLSKNGYNTESYAISIPGTEGNQTYAFPELVSKN